MSYRFERTEPMADGVLRIAREQIRKALKALGQTRDSREGLHQVRTSIKKLRALLRLVRPARGPRFRREDARLHAMANKLSELRDATVLIDTCQALGGFVEKALRPSLRQARRLLGSRRSEIEARLDGAQRRHAIADAFRKTERRIARWTSPRWHVGGSVSVAIPGLVRIYRRGRRAFATAYDKGGAEAFHAWRRAVKYHGYHIRVLGNALPAEMRGRLERVEQLAESLGKDHDLTLLATRLRLDSGSLGDNVKLRLLLRRIAQQQVNLRTTARELGQTLYAEPSSVFRQRLKTTADSRAPTPSKNK